MLKKRILVVDDDPDLRSVLQERLTYRGYRVETAENGHDALTKLDQADFDGVLRDYLMPGNPRPDGLAAHPAAPSPATRGDDDRPDQ